MPRSVQPHRSMSPSVEHPAKPSGAQSARQGTDDEDLTCEKSSSKDSTEFKSEIEGPNAKNCFRSVCEVPNFHGKSVVRAAGPWQADRETAERDRDTLVEAFNRGGSEGLFRTKSELFNSSRTRWK